MIDMQTGKAQKDRLLIYIYLEGRGFLVPFRILNYNM